MGFVIVCQATINPMMLWGQIHVLKCGLSVGGARMV
jgi:hypothetical protein